MTQEKKKIICEEFACLFAEYIEEYGNWLSTLYKNPDISKGIEIIETFENRIIHKSIFYLTNPDTPKIVVRKLKNFNKKFIEILDPTEIPIPNSDYHDIVEQIVYINYMNKLKALAQIFHI